MSGSKTEKDGISPRLKEALKFWDGLAAKLKTRKKEVDKIYRMGERTLNFYYQIKPDSLLELVSTDWDDVWSHYETAIAEPETQEALSTMRMARMGLVSQLMSYKENFMDRWERFYTTEVKIALHHVCSRVEITAAHLAMYYANENLDHLIYGAERTASHYNDWLERLGENHTHSARAD